MFSVKDGKLIRSKKLVRLLQDINWEVNADPYVPDIKFFGQRENWSPTGKDCDSKAMQKRNMLIAAGVPISCLGMACCWDETGGYHAVLMVYTRKGEYVLDNRRDGVVPWRKLPYKWDKRFDPVDHVWRSMK